jgi:hypothetical protein
MLQVLTSEVFRAGPPAPIVPATLVCQKCDGTGRFIGRNGRDLGECFACKGAGRIPNPARVQALAPTVNDEALRAVFDKLRASGLKRIKLRMSGFAVKPAPESGKNAGALYVTEGETYLGKVVGGRFLRVDCCTPEVADKVAALIADPAAAIKATGIETGTCAICGLELTDPESIARGIGPICAERLGA